MSAAPKLELVEIGRAAPCPGVGVVFGSPMSPGTRVAGSTAGPRSSSGTSVATYAAAGASTSRPANVGPGETAKLLRRELGGRVEQRVFLLVEDRFTMARRRASRVTFAPGTSPAASDLAVRGCAREAGGAGHVGPSTTVFGRDRFGGRAEVGDGIRGNRSEHMFEYSRPLRHLRPARPADPETRTRSRPTRPTTASGGADDPG
jgi:hypothetical protein